MDEREKVMRGLKCHAVHGFKMCSECPYYPDEIEYEDDDDLEGTVCEERLASDALTLLKEQEARVMTREEVLALPEGAGVWFEERADNTRDYIGPLVSDGKGYFGDFERGVDMHAVDLMRNRCWSARPTEEQRKAAAWEPPKAEGGR